MYNHFKLLICHFRFLFRVMEMIPAQGKQFQEQSRQWQEHFPSHWMSSLTAWRALPTLSCEYFHIPTLKNKHVQHFLPIFFLSLWSWLVMLARCVLTLVSPIPPALTPSPWVVGVTVLSLQSRWLCDYIGSDTVYIPRLDHKIAYSF